MPACTLQLGWPQTSDEQGGAMRRRAWLPLLGTQWPLWPKVCAASQPPELHKASSMQCTGAAPWLATPQCTGKPRPGPCTQGFGHAPMPTGRVRAIFHNANSGHCLFSKYSTHGGGWAPPPKPAVGPLAKGLGPRNLAWCAAPCVPMALAMWCCGKRPGGGLESMQLHSHGRAMPCCSCLLIMFTRLG